MFTCRKRKLRDYARSPSHETGMQVRSAEVWGCRAKKGLKERDCGAGHAQGGWGLPLLNGHCRAICFQCSK